MTDDDQENREYIKSVMCEVPQFDQLTPAELDLLSRHVIHRNVVVGTVLTREGTCGDSLFYIVEGVIEIKKESVDGKQTVLARFNKGASVGEMSLIEDAPRSATSTAIEDSEILIITRQSFDALVNKNPLIGIKILKNIARALSTRLRHTSGRFADLLR